MLFWWQIGSFGAITRILNIVPNREDLLKVAAAGPIAGFSLGLVLLLLGFLLPPSDGIGVVVDASVFHESLLAGGIGKHFMLYIFASVHLCNQRRTFSSLTDVEYLIFDGSICCYYSRLAPALLGYDHESESEFSFYLCSKASSWRCSQGRDSHIC